MKIASDLGSSRRSMLVAQALFLTLIAGSFSPSSVYALDNPPPMPPLTAAPATGIDAMAGIPSLAGATPGNELGKTVSAMENKISDNAAGVIKTLDASSDAMTLEDLNSARQTVARIEAIIDVEKHLAELEKLRNDRTGFHASSFASAIPASALMPPPPSNSMAMKPVETSERDMPRPVFVPSAPEISRIIGSEGRYTAMIKVNGDMKSVRVGDQLSGNTTVRYISPSSVVLDENGQSRTLRIKNVDAIYSAMR